MKSFNIKTLIGTPNKNGAINGAVGSINGSGGLVGNWILPQNVDSDYVKRYEIIEIPEDLLTLSVCWKRLRDNNQANNIGKLLDKLLFTKIITEDRDKASQIRDYYSKKIMMLKLQSIPLTNFRNDLNEFVHSDGKKFKDSMQQLVYRLPEFYDYDTTFAKFASNYNRSISNSTRATESSKKLSFVKKLIIKTSRHRRTEYWLSDSENNLTCISFDINNPLLSLLDNTLENNSINVNGIFYKKTRDGQDYYKLENFQFTKT